MKNKKLEKKDKILLGVLAALIVIVIAVGVFLIVKNTNDANEQTNTITSSAASGEINSSSQTSSNAESKSSDKKSSDSKSNNSAVNSSSSASDNSQNGGANTPSNSSKKKTSSKASKSSKTKVKGDKVPRVKPKNHTSHASNKTLSVNGKTCYVGDTITVVMNITSNKSIVNYQGTMSFNESYLKVKDVKSNDFGIANASGNNIMYNASTLNGMNFSETGTVFTATFEVLKSGSTKLDNDLEIISELIDNNIKQLSPSDYKATLEVYD